VFDSASVIGVGEAGTEAAIPLTGRRMRPFAEAIGGEISGMDEVLKELRLMRKELPHVMQNLQFVLSLNKREFARAMVDSEGYV